MSPVTSPYESTDRLVELIRKKRQVLLQLCELSHREQALASEGQASVLLQMASAKQHLVTALQMVEKQLSPYHDENPEQRQWRTTVDRQSCAALADECRVLLAQVVELEQAHEQAVIRRRDLAASQLREVNQAGRAAGAYRQYRRDRADNSHPGVPTSSFTSNPVSQLDMSSESR